MPNDATIDRDSTISPDQSFLVHLQSLLDFARELDSQFEAVRKPTDELASLSSTQLLLGEFAEAGVLRARHNMAARQMHELLDAVRSAIGFADDVTCTISESYERYDRHIAGMYGHHRTDSLDAPDAATTVYWGKPTDADAPSTTSGTDAPDTAGNQADTASGAESAPAATPESTQNTYYIDAIARPKPEGAA